MAARQKLEKAILVSRPFEIFWPTFFAGGLILGG
jgi:hypothetical protein